CQYNPKIYYYFIATECGFLQQHAKELRELKGKGFVKVKFNGVEPTEVILYKNIINKIVHDFNIKNQLVSIFLNHDPEKPTRCIFFKKSCCIPQVYLQQDDYEKAFIEEKQQSEEYPNMSLKDEE
ncbi:MAG: hypothetical protein HQ552_11605, partial [Desulfobacteraceae bacterium]|nr:hypothetical protein [Desulfobacteraceae bacterium]